MPDALQKINLSRGGELIMDNLLTKLVYYGAFFSIVLLTMLGSMPAPCPAEETAAVKLSLQEGLMTATQESRVIRIATYNREMAAQDVNIAVSRYFPSLDASAGYTMLAYQPGAIFGSTRVPTANKDYSSYGVNFHQTLFDFFAREAMYKASKESVELTQKDIFRTRNLVALDFINAYFTLLESEKMLSVGQREVEALGSHTKMAQDMFDAGTITKNDLLQAQVKLSDARQRLLTLRNQRVFFSSTINKILTRRLNQEIIPVETAEEPPPMPILELAWETAILRRPEILMSDHDLRINELKETAKKSEFLPSLFTEGGFNYTKNQYVTHEDNWSILFGLKFNIFNGGATKAELSKLRIRTEQIREERNKLIDEVRLEVERYYLDEKSARDNLMATREAILQAEENHRINGVRYEEGVGTATDVLDAISLLTLAHKNYYKALYDMKRAHAGLLYATGEDLTLAYK
jgi:outer membrane protein TolC